MLPCAILLKRKEALSPIGADTYMYIHAAYRMAFIPGEHLNFGQGMLLLGSARMDSWNCKDYNQKSPKWSP